MKVAPKRQNYKTAFVRKHDSYQKISLIKFYVKVSYVILTIFSIYFSVLNYILVAGIKMTLVAVLVFRKN